MSRICQISKKKTITGNRVSHSNNKTKRNFNINYLKKKFFIIKYKKWMILKVSATCIKIMNIIGIQKSLQSITNGKKK